MARGNQREQAREKAQKKLTAGSKGSGREGTKLQRDEEDKAKLEAKVKAKAEAKKIAELEAAKEETKQVVKPKKKKKEVLDLDDLLSAGLSGKQTKGKR